MYIYIASLISNSKEGPFLVLRTHQCEIKSHYRSCICIKNCWKFVMAGSYNYYKMFGCFNRKFKISEAEPPPDVRAAFDRFAEGGSYMRADQLLRFLIEYQLEIGCTISDAEAIMHGVFHHRHHSTKRPGLTLDDFFHFLFQDDLNGPILSQVHHDMTAPLQHYFIYTGHNSYLTGNQLSSDCSEIPIIKSLENGVKGIELDLWPNSGKDSVHVLHGRTLTTPIPLMKCLKSIKEYAFIKSPYPVIITLEDHLTPELQAKVAEMVMQIFGDLLYYPESGFLESFPSPEELKHKIILSTKPPKEYLESKSIKDQDISSPMEKDSSEDEITLGEMSDPTVSPQASDKSDCEQDDDDVDYFRKNSSVASAPEFKRLTALQNGMVKKDLMDAVRNDLSYVDHHESLESKSFVDQETSTPTEKDSSGNELSLKEMSIVKSEANIYDEISGNNQDINSIQQKSSRMAAPEFKRLTAIQTGKVEIGSGLSVRYASSNDNHKEYLEARALEDHGISSPMEYDSSKEELSLRESEDVEKIDYALDDGSIQHKTSNIATPEFKRLTAFHTGKVKKGLRRSMRNRGKDDRESRNSNAQYVSSPMENDTSDDESFLKEASSPVDGKSDSDQGDEDIDFIQQRSGSQSSPEYTRLIAIHAGKVRKGLRHALRSTSNKVNRLSLSEQTLERATASYPMDVVRFSQKNILRVFPKGTRVTSSNFKPTIGWMHGAQMIAFNMQGYGKSLWMMHGMFRSNGGCGFVKKPDLLMKRDLNNEVFDPKKPLPVKQTLKVKVYMGDGWRLDFSHTHFDSFSPPDFYTKVYIIGVPADAAKRKTRIIEDDWGPYWGEEFSFSLSVPELALLRVEVREHDISDKDDFGGQTCLPILELRPGIRAVPLYDKKGQKLKSVRLLMRFQLE